ncbi:type III toxin-antitoxin system ToxN/AbiQ family toxin [Glaesserella parasuis]|nr:type III toxin-antitoxin system ToxN/AbiQ family toxin [Glaesserella parasuis]
MKQELQLKLCRINPEYTKFLHSIDTRISPEKELDKNKRRIFVGVVLTINHISYFAPLSSAPILKIIRNHLISVLLLKSQRVSIIKKLLRVLN